MKKKQLVINKKRNIITIIVKQLGHHIGERAHVIEREQNVYSGDAEERQEFINLDEDEAEDFDK